MDNTRLNTMGCLNAGILDRPAPDTACPKNFDRQRVNYEWTEESLWSGLEKGGLSATMCYGCWKIWKTEKGYSGELLQYRKITDSFSDDTIEYAFKKAQEWAIGCNG